MESQCRQEADGNKGAVLHIVVVGFHHKKGCQVEFSYPPLLPDESHDSGGLPEQWRYLPFLALPDGAHNYQEGPLYGLLQAKLQLITHGLLWERELLTDRLSKGLSPRDLILHFRHKVLILFKLILLEKKVLFYVSPVNTLVGTLMTVLSLFPGMIEHGLADSSHYRPKSSVSDELGSREETTTVTTTVTTPSAEEFVSVSASDVADAALELVGEELSPAVGDAHLLKPPARSSPDSSESDWETLDPSVLEEAAAAAAAAGGSPREQATGEKVEDLPETFDPEPGVPITVQPQAGAGQGGVVQGLVSGLEEDQYGLPLAVFTKGYLCLPYMALQQHHLLSDVAVRGFVAGATNILFRQQRHLSDAIVDDPELRRLLALTTADLRFADYLLKHVTENREDVFLDGTGWEGGDEWIRAQFTLYLHTLLSSTLHQDSERLLADYGAPFTMAWKITHNYRVWQSNRHHAMTEITPGHPFQGQYSVADVKLRLSHSVQNSERGKKIGNAMMTTSRNVVQTGKAVGQSVGGALTSAKSAMSSWFSTLAQPPALTTPPGPEGDHREGQ
ncbi:hypothetical protein CRUP_003690 [Coryphaenoides rupestris]|nr:hypothetical protein CRUP_003690 [Coryphaenoides rupestris]